jgi:hypothetical protein
MIFLCFATLAASCTSAQRSAAPSLAEQQLFLRFIDELPNEHPSAALSELERLYPQRPTTERARILAETFAKRQLLIIQMQKDRSRCQQEKERLAKDFRQLQEDHEKLRKLVVEMEKRRR